MGIGKNIEGVGISDIYHPNPEQFIRNVSERFKVNVDYYLDGDKQNLQSDSSFVQSISVRSSRSEKLRSYDIDFPIADPEKEFSFSFYPNNVFSFMHIPFVNGWGFFIADLFGDYLGTQSKEDFQKEWQAVRSLYLPLMECLNCQQLLITTDAGYNWEWEIFFSERFGKKYSFQDLLDCVKKLDWLQILSLTEAFDFKLCDTLRKLYDEKRVYDVAFVDQMGNCLPESQ